MKGWRLERWKTIYHMKQEGGNWHSIARELNMDPKSVAYAYEMYVDRYVGYN